MWLRWMIWSVLLAPVGGYALTTRFGCRSSMMVGSREALLDAEEIRQMPRRDEELAASETVARMERSVRRVGNDLSRRND